jgi:putative transposase
MTRAIIWQSLCLGIERLWRWLLVFFHRHRASPVRGRRIDTTCHTRISVRTCTKPPWVHEEIVWLAARDSQAGCRRLADIFNRRHAVSGGMTVGKSFVANALRQHACEVMRLRRDLRKRRYKPGRPNVVWGIDGTGKTDEANDLHFLLGIVDHGTRRCLTLEALKNKTSITILRALLDAIERYGKPQAIRTDNEAIFHSRLFRTGLRLLGIRHQTIERHCPWQNGRIERFFGTLKAKLDHWAVADGMALNSSLAVFQLWYNHVRPHQHLESRTPAEVWQGVDVYRRRYQRRLWFEAWDGLLQGEYLQR